MAYELRISDWSSDVCFSDLILHPALFGRRLPRRLISLASIPLRFALRRRGDGRGDAVATSIVPHSVQLLQIPFARPISPYFQTLATGFEPRCPSERLTAGNMDVRPPAMASDGNEIAHNLVALAGGDEPSALVAERRFLSLR